MKEVKKEVVRTISSFVPYTLSEQRVLQHLSTSKSGLSSSEADERLHQYGFNEIHKDKGPSPFVVFLHQFTSPLIWILLGALIVSIFLDEATDAVVIGVIILLNAILGFFQEYRAEKSIEALQKLTSPKARVLRGGKPTIIDSKYVVPGDILLLEAGDSVAADGRLIEVHTLEVQEGSLTGESHPVSKILSALPESTSLADQRNMVFASTIITMGRGAAVVIATGMNTQVGNIATLIQQKEEKKTPLQEKLSEVSSYITVAVVLVAAMVFLIGFFLGYDLRVMFLTAIALAVAAIPEGLPAVITISLAVGVQRMVQRHALVRKLPSVETLGSVDVICTDKTGTLTHNKMTVTRLWANKKVYDATDTGYAIERTLSSSGKAVDTAHLELLLRVGLLCNNASVGLGGEPGESSVMGDPTEVALLVSATKIGLLKEKEEQAEQLVHEIPFTSERKMMTVIRKKGKPLLSYTKGALGVILPRCDRIVINGRVQRLDRTLIKEIQAQHDLFASGALRVLAFAYNDSFSTYEAAEKGMIFVGLQAMMDPPRAGVRESIQECYNAGIRVIMITGDHIETAKAIATELGITGAAVSGEEFSSLNLEEEIDDIGIFARVNPEHKLAIVRALQNKGHIVAMTGDGVNDAPALKKANIGVAMGMVGTEVAKEASDMILADDNFTSIVNAVEEGRGVYDNIKKFFAFLVSGNLVEVGIIAIAMILTLPLPLSPLLILFVNLVTDGLPAIALGMDPFEPHAMLRPPRKAEEPFYKGLAPFVIVYPILVTVLALGFFAWMIAHGENIAKAQTVVFMILVLSELFQAFAARSIRYPSFSVGLFRNPYLVVAVMLSFGAGLAVVYVPFLQSIFGTTALSLAELGVLILCSSAGFVYLEMSKWWGSRKEVMDTSSAN